MTMKYVNIIFLTICIASKVHASVVLDQSFLDGPSATAAGDLDPRLGQTFTVGLDGTLDKVVLTDVVLRNVTLDIYATDNGVPRTFGTQELATAELVGEFTGMVEVPLRSSSLAVRDGDVLTIVLSGDQVQWGIGFAREVPGYLRGDAFVADDNGAWKLHAGPADRGDFHFQTFVDVIPEPSTAFLLGIGLIAGLLPRRRRE